MRTILVCENSLHPNITKLAKLISAKLDEQGPVKCSFSRAEEVLLQSAPDMAVVVLSGQEAAGLDVLRKLRRATSRYLLAVGPASDSQLILNALNSGADHYLNENDLETGLEAVLSRFSAREETAQQGRILALLAASGGSGASTLAVNIATLFAKEQGKSALVDLKPGHGDLSALLDLRPKYNLADVCLNAARLDQAMFEKMLAPHTSGIHLLSSPPSFCDARVITSAGVTSALTMARKLFAHVVVDVEDCFHDEQVAALQLANSILLISRLDFTSLRNARRVMDHLKQLGINRYTIRVVINRHGQSCELPVEEAESALGEKISCFIPEDSKTFNAANNIGIPAALKFPKAKVFQSIAGLMRIALDRRRPNVELPAYAAGTKTA